MNLEKLLQPISEDNPSGKNLRYETVYDEIKELRKEDDPNIPQGIWEGEKKVADWSKVQELCIQALTKETKDLQLAAWLLEAIMFQKQFEGLEIGFQCILDLCKNFWESIYPSHDEDPEFKISPFIWINDVVSNSLKKIPITKTEENEQYNYHYLDYEEMQRIEMLRQQTKTNQEVDQKLLRTSYEKSLKKTPLKFYESNFNAIEKSLEIIKELETFLENNCEIEAPSFANFKETLEILSNFFTNIIKQKGNKIENTKDTEDTKEVNMTEFSSMQRPKSRQEAFQALSDIADYLIETDPHSPVAYLVKRAVLWGNMELQELIPELLKHGQNIQQVYDLLGIQK